VSSPARRYAKALFSLAQEQGQIEAIGEQLFAAAAELSLPEVAELANSPRLSSERRQALIGAVAQQLALTPLLTNFLQVVAEKHRLRNLTAIASQFQKLEDQALGRLRMTIRSAKPLPEAERDEIAAAFGRQLQRTVIATTEVDPELLGGLVVDADGKVYDGSVRSQLERLAKQIAHPDSH
jgi:F-type H+-transporting ATPase subunit delta